jgi:hypothetical protein
VIFWCNFQHHGTPAQAQASLRNPSHTWPSSVFEDCIRTHGLVDQLGGGSRIKIDGDRGEEAGNNGRLEVLRPSLTSLLYQDMITLLTYHHILMDLLPIGCYRPRTCRFQTRRNVTQLAPRLRRLLSDAGKTVVLDRCNSTSRVPPTQNDNVISLVLQELLEQHYGQPMSLALA